MAAYYTVWNGDIFQVNQSKGTVCHFTLESDQWRQVHYCRHEHHLCKVVTSLDVESDVILPHLIKRVERDNTKYYVILQWDGNDFVNQTLIKECTSSYNITSQHFDSLILITSKHLIDDSSDNSTHWCCPWLPTTPYHNLLITRHTSGLNYSFVTINDNNFLTFSPSLSSRFIPSDYTDILISIIIHWYFKIEGSYRIPAHPLFIIYTSMGQVLLLEEGRVKCSIHSDRTSSIVNVIALKTPDDQLGVVVHQSDLTLTVYKIPYNMLNKGLTTPPTKWCAWSRVHHVLSSDFMRKGHDQILLIFEKESLHNFLITDLVNELLNSSDLSLGSTFENGVVAMETDAPPTSLLATSQALHLRQIKNSLMVDRKKVEKQLKEELFGKSLHVLENMCRGINTGITEDKRLFTLISSDGVPIIKSNQTPLTTPYRMTTPLQLQDSWQRCFDESIVTVLIITNKGQQCLSDLSFWLQSCDISPLHSSCTFTAKGYLTSTNKYHTHQRESLVPLCLEKEESVCVVMTTKPPAHKLILQAVVMATWTCYEKRMCAEITMVKLDTNDIIMSNMSSSLQWIDTSDITLSNQDEWKELTAIIGSRHMTALKTNMESPLFSLLKNASSPLLVAIDVHLIHGTGPLKGLTLFCKNIKFILVYYKEECQLKMLLNILERILPDSITVSFC